MFRVQGKPVVRDSDAAGCSSNNWLAILELEGTMAQMVQGKAD